LNFVLHAIWGHQLNRQALKFSALDDMQYTLPGQTCNNAALNKLLFRDLSRQTLSPGILTGYDATAALDRVLANLSIVTYQRVSLPRIAVYFMSYLLQNMSFTLITWVGKSADSYQINMNGQTGQGVLQGSRSAAPIYILNSDIYSFTNARTRALTTSPKYPTLKVYCQVTPSSFPCFRG
jgi:hypothetical protein